MDSSVTSTRKTSVPPWFCQHLKYHTSDDLELRLCSLWNSNIEDKLVSFAEIYVN